MNGIVLALLAGSALLGSDGAATDSTVREAWAGSPELPTAIAYYEFARLLAETRSTPHAYAHLLADAFDVPDVDSLRGDDLRELRSQGDVFVAHYTSMQLEVLESRMRILCAPSASRRASSAAHYASLNAADDISRPIQQKYLALALAGLRGERKHVFRSFLDEFKSSVSYTKLDNRPGKDASGLADDAGARVEQACADMQTEYARVLQQGGL